MSSVDDVVQFVRDETGFTGSLTPETTLQHDIGVFGDDMHEFMIAYAKRFDVDITSYRWYFHTGEEGSFSIGSFFFRPPYQRVQEIPITIAMLRSFAEVRQWGLDYPEHKLPNYRIDIFTNQIFVVVVFGFLAVVLWHRCSH